MPGEKINGHLFLLNTINYSRKKNPGVHLQAR